MKRYGWTGLTPYEKYIRSREPEFRCNRMRYFVLYDLESVDIGQFPRNLKDRNDYILLNFSVALLSEGFPNGSMPLQSVEYGTIIGNNLLEFCFLI